MLGQLQTPNLSPSRFRLPFVLCLLRPEGRNERDPKARGNPPAKATIDQAQYTCGLLDWEEVKGGSIIGNNLARQLIADHLVEGEMRPGEEIALKVDQFLLHDGTGPLCALQLEAMGVEQDKRGYRCRVLRPSPR